MEPLTATERQVIRAMLVKQYGPGSVFLDQLAAAKVEKRELTGVGVFVNLEIAVGIAAVDRVNAEISEFYRTLLRPPADVVGFILFIRDGYLSLLEGYTIDPANWPDGLLENWLVLDAA